jgi:hypothetical protein
MSDRIPNRHLHSPEKAPLGLAEIMVNVRAVFRLLWNRSNENAVFLSFRGQRRWDPSEKGDLVL